MRGATVVDHVALTKGQISIHTPHAGRDPQRPTARSAIRNFNPHAPCGARRGMAMISTPSSYFNPHAPCGARPMPSRKEWVDMVISIHTPHAGRDGCRSCRPDKGSDFNPHAPCGARPSPVILAKHQHGISIHTPHAGRDPRSARIISPSSNFNPHAPCGARRSSPFSSSGISRFQSTRPMRGATVK